MHLADGTVSNAICTTTAAISAGAVAFALSRVRNTASARNLLRAGAGAAIVFVAQMFDVPLFGGVGVHLVGAAFLTLLCGPALALVAMAVILTVQALALGDGGVTALGANIFNMGVVAVAVSYAFTFALRSRSLGLGATTARIAAASALSVMAAVVAMSLELVLSGTSAAETLALTLPAHAPFALFETAATVVLVVLAARAGAFRTARVPAGAGK
jgi:cobalt/nickel transport system permease protein